MQQDQSGADHLLTDEQIQSYLDTIDQRLSEIKDIEDSQRDLDKRERNEKALDDKQGDDALM